MSRARDGACPPGERSPGCAQQLAQLEELLTHDSDFLKARATEIRAGGSGGLKPEGLPAVRAVLATPVVASHFDARDDLDRQLREFNARDRAWIVSDAGATVFADLTMRRAVADAHAESELRYHLDDLVRRLEGQVHALHPLPKN